MGRKISVVVRLSSTKARRQDMIASVTLLALLIEGQGAPPSAALPQNQEGLDTSTNSSSSAVSAEELKMIEESFAKDATTHPGGFTNNPGTTGTADGTGSGSSGGPGWFGQITSAVQSTNPDLSLILDVAGSYFGGGEPNQLGDHDPKGTGFALQQLEMHLSANVDPFFRMDANLVFSLEGVEVEEVYGTTLALPLGLQARVGTYLTNFGRINATHPHTWNFVDQPLVIGKFFGADGNRGLGAELSWLSPLPWYLEASFSTNMPQGDCCARSYAGSEDEPHIRTMKDLMYTATIKQFFPFDEAWSLSLGVSGQLGPSATSHAYPSAIYGTDVYLRYRPPHSADRTSVSLQFEGMYRRRKEAVGLLEDMGLYGQLVWNIDPEWELGGRYEYVSGVEDDPVDPAWTKERQRAALEVAYAPSHFSRIRLQGSYDLPKDTDEPVYAAMLALELTIGAHGAHPF